MDDNRKLALVETLNKALDAALLYRLAYNTGSKIGAQDMKEASASMDAATIAVTAALAQSKQETK
jgi:hypothetical protein